MKSPIIIITLLVCTLFTTTIFAQSTSKKDKEDYPFKKGQVDISVGMGLITFPAMGIYTKNASIPMQGSIDVGISKFFAVGINYGRVKMESDMLRLDAPRNRAYQTKEGFEMFDRTVTNVSLRFTAHYLKIEKMDIYGGLMTGYKFENIKSHNEGVDKADFFDDNDSKIRISGILGMRYHLKLWR